LRLASSAAGGTARSDPPTISIEKWLDQRRRDAARATGNAAFSVFSGRSKSIAMTVAEP
jgi:hypothetical protein